MRFARQRGRSRPRRVTQVFASQRDDRGLYYRAVHLDPDGSLVVEGHDLGAGAAGGTEYEFTRTVAPAEVDRVRSLLGIDPKAPLLGHLLDEFGSTVDLERWLADHDIESEFVSRVG